VIQGRKGRARVVLLALALMGTLIVALVLLSCRSQGPWRRSRAKEFLLFHSCVKEC
jgi:hypothetical protein